MPRYIIRYEKGGQARFVGHLDTMKNFERVFRRANLPIAFSQGFNPHPKLSFASPLAVGVTGAAEFADFHLTEEMEPETVKEAIVNVMLPGFKVLGIKKMEDSIPALMSAVRLGSYIIEIPLEKEWAENLINEEIDKLLTREDIIVERVTKKGLKKKDIKKGIQQLAGRVEGNEIILEALLDLGSVNNIRPEEIVKALKEYTNIPIDFSVGRIHRNGVYAAKDVELDAPEAEL